MPKIDKFKGKEDPKEHLIHFKHACNLIANDDALLLRTFPMILWVQAMNWYNSLSQHSLYSFEKNLNLILECFSTNIKKRNSIIDLIKLSQFDQESISKFVSKWCYMIMDMNFSLHRRSW